MISVLAYTFKCSISFYLSQSSTVVNRGSDASRFASANGPGRPTRWGSSRRWTFSSPNFGTELFLFGFPTSFGSKISFETPRHEQKKWTSSKTNSTCIGATVISQSMMTNKGVSKDEDCGSEDRWRMVKTLKRQWCKQCGHGCKQQKWECECQPTRHEDTPNKNYWVLKKIRQAYATNGAQNCFWMLIIWNHMSIEMWYIIQSTLSGI